LRKGGLFLSNINEILLPPALITNEGMRGVFSSAISYFGHTSMQRFKASVQELTSDLAALAL
jgi:hypothetical protein